MFKKKGVRLVLSFPSVSLFLKQKSPPEDTEEGHFSICIPDTKKNVFNAKCACSSVAVVVAVAKSGNFEAV